MNEGVKISQGNIIPNVQGMADLDNATIVNQSGKYLVVHRAFSKIGTM